MLVRLSWRAVVGAVVVAVGLGLGMASGCAVGGKIVPGDDASVAPDAPVTTKTCDAGCPSGQVCDNGACVSTCKTGELDCASVCVDPKTDPKHCGSCSNVCPQGLSCVVGQCLCTPPTTSCQGTDGGTSCVDTSKDMSNCGACGSLCDDAGPHATPACTNGACGVGTCDTNYGDCNKDAGDGCESDLTSDKNNCKTCGTVCSQNTPVCVNGTCVATLCGNNVIDTNERCDGTLGVPAGGQITCRPGGSANECKFDFSQVPQLYCNGSCTWAGSSGCDQADADVYCKLLKGSSTSTATSFSVVTALGVPGFSCPGYGTNLGAMSEYGVSVSVWYQGTSILANHGAGSVITSAVCTP